MPISCDHPETTASRPPGCACGHPFLSLLPGASPVLFQAACCFAVYKLDAMAPALPVLSLVKEGPEKLGPGVCDGCGGDALDLWAVPLPPSASGVCLCRECLEEGIGGILAPETASF